MKKICLFCLMFCLGASVISAQEKINEAQQLGSVAGVALACNAGKKLDDYELIASYIMANQATDEKARKEAFGQYAEEKLRTYNYQRKEKPTPCPQVLQTFSNLPLFKSVIYKDGTIKLPDGKVLKPKASNVKRPENAKQNKRNYMVPGRGD